MEKKLPLVLLRKQIWKTPLWVLSFLKGPESGGRTHTVLLPADFESAKSSYSIISGKPVKVCYYAKESTLLAVLVTIIPMIISLGHLCIIHCHNILTHLQQSFLLSEMWWNVFCKHIWDEVYNAQCCDSLFKRWLPLSQLTFKLKSSREKWKERRFQFNIQFIRLM